MWLVQSERSTGSTNRWVWSVIQEEERRKGERGGGRDDGLQQKEEDVC